MSEARIRGLNQSKSSIFSSSPASRTHSRDIPQTQSKIFEPLVYTPKPMTFAREAYQKTTINLGSDSPVGFEEPKLTNFSNSSPAGKKTNQINSTKYLLGNERSTFFKKSVNEHLGVPKEFEPQYSGGSAFERKQKELHQGFSPSKQESPNKKEKEFASAKERKMNDRVSVFDRNNYKPEVFESPKEKPIAYSPNQRKNETMSSNVFGERIVQEYKKPTELKENDRERRKNHLYSDLFGLKSRLPEKKQTDRLQPYGHFLNSQFKPNQDYNPKSQANKFLASSIDLGDSPAKPSRARPKTPQNSLTPRFELSSGLTSSQIKQQELCTTFIPFQQTQNPKIFDLELSSVPAEVIAGQIKELCGGVHVVSLALDMDNFTGGCKGTGRLKVRTAEQNDIVRIEKIFKAKGISIKEHQENIGKKSNYSAISNVHWHSPYEYKRASTPCGATESKMKNLESSVFDGQRKWVNRNIESVDGELLAQMQWKNTKNASRPYY